MYFNFFTTCGIVCKAAAVAQFGSQFMDTYAMMQFICRKNHSLQICLFSISP